jgi:hypothetical protein
MDAAGQPACQERIRPVIAELITMEQANARALAERRTAAEGEQNQFQLVERNLRQVHQAYAPQASPAWHSYS